MENQGMISGSAGSVRPSRWAGLMLAVALAMTAATTQDARAQTGNARLGSPKTMSYLGQPLQVVIPIQLQPGADAQDSRWTLGNRPAQSGMPYLERGRLTVEQTPEGLALVVRSSTPIHEPAIGIVVQEVTGSGAVGREFAVLLDPPPLVQEPPVAAPTASVPASAAPLASMRPAPLDAAPAPASSTRNTPKASPLPAVERKQSPRPARKAEPSIAAGPSTSPDRAITKDATAAPAKRARDANGPRLVLSMDSGLSARKEASEEERAALRVRQMLLYLDDLTAAINERQNKIAQLEKELAGLNQLAALREELDSISLRVKNAETEARKTGAAPAAGSLPVVDDPSAQPAKSVALSAVVGAPAAAQLAPDTPRVVPPAAPAQSTSQPGAGFNVPTSWSAIWPAILLALGFASVILFAWLRRRQHQHASLPVAEDEHFLWSADAPGPDVEVPEEEGVRDQSQPAPMRRSGVADNADGPERLAARHSQIASPDAARTNTNTAALDAKRHDNPALVAPGSIAASDSSSVLPQFELPAELSGGGDQRSHLNAIQDGSGARRLRYLRIRYADIAAMNPALDHPARLLHQAGEAYGEGAVEHAKRLLKFAAYSRPEKEAYWLALLELLYRERWINEYSVTAHWFHHWCPESIEWNEVLRLGYMLNPADARFQIASHWSKVEPNPGLWLPVAAVANIALPHLDLQLVNE